MSPYQGVIDALQQLVDSGSAFIASAVITDREGQTVKITVPVTKAPVSASPWSGYVSAGSGLSEPDQTSRASR